MSISPATSEVGSSTAIANSKSATNSPRNTFNGLSPFQLQKGIAKSTSGNVANCSKVGGLSSSNRRIRTSSYNSSTSSFSASSKVGSRKELDRADLDLDWRSASRLRSSSGSSEESNRTKKGDERAAYQLDRADLDHNWRNHADLLNSPTPSLSSQLSNWRSKEARNRHGSPLGTNPNN